MNNRLDTPGNVSINLDNYLLSWSRVDNARGYEIRVSHVPKEDGDPVIYSVGSSKISYSLQILEEGDYTVSVRATAGSSKTYSNSEWSADISLDKDYYSGCTFSLVNNATAYEVTGWTKPADGLVEIEIPDTYRDKPVIGIAANAFKSKTSLEGVTVLGDNLQYVGKNAFYSCTKLKYVNLPGSVTEIGEGAFHSCRVMTGFDIPEKVTKIEDSTFLYCRGLESIDLKNVESIGASAFMGCNEALKSVVIPDSVLEVGQKAFADCSVLEEVTIGAGVPDVPDYAFQNCKNLKKVTFSEKETGSESGETSSAMKEICEFAFSGCTSLSDITLPYGLETIGSYAFNRDSSLEDVNIPETVTKIGSDAFVSTGIYESQEEDMFVYVGLESAAENSLDRSWIIGYNEEALESDENGQSQLNLAPSMLDDTLIGFADYAFYGKTTLSTAEFPKNVQYFGDYSFCGCSRTIQIVIDGSSEAYYAPDVYIGSYAFANMTSLSNFRFVEANGVSVSGVKEIGDHAFYGDKILTSVDIPTTVEKIGGYAFRNSGIATSGLDSNTNVIYAGIINDDESKSIKNGWVVGYNGYTTSEVALKSGTRGIADYAFTRDTYLSTVSNMGNVSFIGEGAFYKCSNLTSVSIPQYIEEIGDYTFYNCSSLVSLGSTFSGGALGPYLKSIGRSAFYGCSNLSTLSLASSSVEYIGKYAFYHCDSLKELKLGGSLKEIDDYAFYKSGLETVSFPQTLERIGEKAFYKCASLKEIDFGEDGETIELSRYAFYKCSALETLTVTGRIEEVGEYAFSKCEAVKELEIEEGVKRIDAGAFANFSITSLHIPSSVEYIGSYAFKSCKDLTSVIIPKTVTVIESNAFYGLTSATFYTDADELMPQWDVKLNSSYSPFVWGCELSEDGDYVVSVKISDGSVENVVRIEGNEEEETDDGDEDAESRGEVNYSSLCGAPEREGYVFLGWALTEGGLVVYSADELDEVYAERGEITLYAVWEKSFK
ncbi:MAG: leucine-rich repeat protein [Clostridia bacterium]|nr:leucine-rich repeat protein [Clostridia bacterium]